MDATLVTGWEALGQLLGAAFTRPTYITFLHIATGWELCRSKPRVTNLVCTIGSSLLGQVAKNWTVHERLFYRAAWSLVEISRRLLIYVVAPLVKAHATETVIALAIDDTTCGRCGKHVAYAGYFKDASVGNTLKAVVHWAHNCVIGCVTMTCKRWPNWVIGLPVLFTLYRKRRDCNRRLQFLPVFS